MQRARTIFDKIWDSHVVTEREDGECLVYVDPPTARAGWMPSPIRKSATWWN
jgi:homoaconitase/3-isopropylmalate dehydratase large subunit